MDGTARLVERGSESCATTLLKANQERGEFTRSMGSSGTRHRSLWLQVKDDILLEGFDHALCLKEIAAKLPGRSKRAVDVRRYIVLEKNDRTVKHPRGLWTKAEDAILLEEYAKGISHQDIATKLPGQDAGSCDRRVKGFQQKSRKAELNGDDFDVRRMALFVPWTEAEDALLLEEYAKGTRFKAVATKLPGSKSSEEIRGRACSRAMDLY